MKKENIKNKFKVKNPGWKIAFIVFYQEKLALLKYTYEQVLATQAEQIESKSNNTDNIPEFGKILIKDGIRNNEVEFKLHVG